MGSEWVAKEAGEARQVGRKAGEAAAQLSANPTPALGCAAARRTRKARFALQQQRVGDTLAVAGAAGAAHAVHVRVNVLGGVKVDHLRGGRA